MNTRKEIRSACARYLNSISKDDLFKRFEITRVANLTGYDVIGVPIYSCARPCGKMISVSGGKGITQDLARAGAVAEAIEFQVFENPVGKFKVEQFRDKLALPTAAGGEWTPETPVAVEEVTHFASGTRARLPSDIVWMGQRVQTPRFFMRSSNGQAVGSTFYDAFVQGLYEVVERDQVTLRRLAWQKLGVIPPRVEIPQSMSDLDAQIAASSLELFLFACSLDIHLPTFWAIIAGEGGTFAGYGTHLRSEVAAERAILEAIQSRAVMLSGARDDILRRNFETNRDRTLKQAREELGSVPVFSFPQSGMPELYLEDELLIVLHKLSAWRQNIYFKHIDLGDLHAVKTIILGLECPKFAGESKWRPIRFSMLVQAYLDAGQSAGILNSGAVQRLKEISFET